jgi:ribosome modulation factor
MLEDLLAEHSWQEADMETGKLLRCYATDEFPCEDLRMIDRLWVDYSNGLFGFSVQNAIYQRISDRYQQIGGTRYYMKEPWEEFVDSVGWRKNNTWVGQSCTFDLTAPKGHLPVLGGWDEAMDDLGDHQWLGLSLGIRAWYSQVTEWHQSDISDCNRRYFSSLMSRVIICDIRA